MSHVFISYSRKDIEAAKNLKAQLEAGNFTIWMDTKEIESGDQWKERILDGLERCTAFVILLSPQSARSMWVMRELTVAQELHKPVFPYLLDGESPWPLVEDLQCVSTVEALRRGLNRVARLFISYASADNDFAEKLRDDLEKLGADICQHGDEKPSCKEGIESSQILLLVISPESMTSPEIRSQWENFNKAGKLIIPILLRQVPVAARLRDLQYVDFLNQDYDLSFAQLYGMLVAFGVNLNDHEKVSIPPQPPLRMDGKEMIYAAKRTLWISGIGLDSISRRDTSLETESTPPFVLEYALKKNPRLHVRILMLDLDVQVANEAGAWVGINKRKFKDLEPSQEFKAWAASQKHNLTREGHWVAQRIFRNRQALRVIFKFAPDRVEVRTVSHRIGVGYHIIDHNLEDGILTAAPYFFDIDHVMELDPARYNTPPILLSRRSSKESDLWWFKQYLQEYKRIWKKATPWKPN